MPKKLKRPPVEALPYITRGIEELAADPDNPRVISDAALAGLGVSAAEFGDISGVVWNRRTGQLVCGHQRVKALAAAGATAWFIVDDDHGFIAHPNNGARFGIRVVDWDLTKQRIANLVANSPSIAGEFTAAALAQVRALEDEALFESLRLDELQRALGAQFPQGEVDAGGDGGEGDTPPPPATPFTQRGDMWLMGEHRLLCGDATDQADIAALLGGELPVLGLHDPPYGISIQNKDGSIGGGRATDGRQLAKPYPMIAGDDRPFDPRHLLGSGATVVIWGGNHFADKLPPSAAWVVWDKKDGMLPNDFSDAELAWVSKGGSVRLFRLMWSGWARKKEEDDGNVRVHPTQKPIALYRWIIEQHTEPGELVYDAYAGSGPTVLACEKLGRRARVMELSPAYADVIVARWEQMTGKRALLRRDGRIVERAEPARPDLPDDADHLAF